MNPLRTSAIACAALLALLLAGCGGTSSVESADTKAKETTAATPAPTGPAVNAKFATYTLPDRWQVDKSDQGEAAQYAKEAHWTQLIPSDPHPSAASAYSASIPSQEALDPGMPKSPTTAELISWLADYEKIPAAQWKQFKLDGADAVSSNLGNEDAQHILVYAIKGGKVYRISADAVDPSQPSPSRAQAMSTILDTWKWK